MMTTFSGSAAATGAVATTDQAKARPTARVRADRNRSRNAGPRCSRLRHFVLREGSPPAPRMRYAPMVCEGHGRWGQLTGRTGPSLVLLVVGHHQQALQAAEVERRPHESGLGKGVAVLLNRLDMAD